MNPNFPQISLDLNEPETETQKEQIMNDLTTHDHLVTFSNGQAVTTSLAIAEGTEHEHRVVLKLIREHLSDFEDFGRVAFEVRPFTTMGGIQQREVAILNEHQATMLVTFMRNIGVVKNFKKSLVKAFFELAKAKNDPLERLADPAFLRSTLLTYTEKVIALEHKVGELTPKAEALDRIALADGNHNLTVTAKIIEVSPRKMIDSMHANKWIYHRAGGKGNLAYQDKIQKGWLTHKITTVQREDGSEKIVEQVLVTPKGLTVLARLLGKTGLFETVPEAV